MTVFFIFCPAIRWKSRCDYNGDYSVHYIGYYDVHHNSRKCAKILAFEKTNREYLKAGTLFLCIKNFYGGDRVNNTERGKLKIEHLSPEVLIPYEGNPRVHTEAQIQKLMASIKEYGIVLPVLIDTNNVIIARHAVVTACINLGIS